MELARAFDTLGLDPGASVQEVEAAYRRLCDDFDARIGRVTSLALRDRYAAARAELEAARAAAIQVAGQTVRASGQEDPHTRSWDVLGLQAGASPLEVASAYVSLCEELDRELDSAPTEALRRRCLEARAEIDAAYQLCAAAPLAESGEAQTPPSGYETQMAPAAFEARQPEPPPEPAPAAIEIVTDPAPVPTRRRRRRPLRRFGAFAFTLLIACAATLGYGWTTKAEWFQLVKRVLPLPPAPALVEAQSAAEYLRRRVVEERRDIEQRADVASQRVDQLQAASYAETEPEARHRAEVALEQAQSRTNLASRLRDLTERHVFSSSALAEAYGRMELGAELAEAGEPDRAIAAYSEARSHLEATLESLDEAESALGVRSEALAARDAWIALAASAGLEPGAAIRDGGTRLEAGDRLLEEGNFAGATPELRSASQHFRTALDEGRRILAEERERAEAEARNAPPEEEAEQLASNGSPPETNGSHGGREAVLASVSPGERADVKLVAIPAGAFLYGCNGLVEQDCADSEPAGRRTQVDAFRIDRTEVRVSEYKHCVDAGVCAAPATGGGCNWENPGRGDHPVNCIAWEQASAYCGWVGKRLPTEQEWEKAARGTDGRTYPWGNVRASCEVAVMSEGGSGGCGRSSTAPVGSLERGRSPYGLFDMAGNVLEWTVSLHESGSGARVLRGGSWQNGAGFMRSSHREGASPKLRHESVGLRCAEGAVVAENGAS
ncbi:MAG: SUMF1/EgtB/PvdO family nonheme iron enzyme [Myxococcota bacterium]